MRNIFKKKKAPIDPGIYDWTFQFIRGGFAPNEALRRDKRYRAIVWLGGFNFKLIWVRKGSEATFFRSFPQEPVEYSVRMKFDADLLKEYGVKPQMLNTDENSHTYEYYDCLYCHGKGCDICGGTGKGVHEVKKTGGLQCNHDWQIAVNRETNRFSDMVCSKCGEIHKTKQQSGLYYQRGEYLVSDSLVDWFNRYNTINGCGHNLMHSDKEDSYMVCEKCKMGWKIDS